MELSLAIYSAPKRSVAPVRTARHPPSVGGTGGQVGKTCSITIKTKSLSSVTGLSWKNEHGFHIIDPTHFLFFNNNTGPNSAAIEAELSLSGGKGTAKQVWSCASNLTVQILGNVQRLANGNTLIAFSTAGEIREVNASGTVLQTIKSVGSGSLFGFAEKRKSLYGPPPR